MAEAKGILQFLQLPWAESPYQEEADAAVAWLTGAGILQGNAQGDLMLDQPVTRRQLAVILYRFAKKYGII